MITNRVYICLSCLYLLGNLDAVEVCAMQDSNSFHLNNENKLYRRRIDFSETGLNIIPYEIPAHIDILQPIPQGDDVTYTITDSEWHPLYHHPAIPKPKSTQPNPDFRSRRFGKRPPKLTLEDFGTKQQPDAPLERLNPNPNQSDLNLGDRCFQRRFTTPIFDDLEDNTLVSNNLGFKYNQPNTPPPPKSQNWENFKPKTRKGSDKPKSYSVHSSFDYEQTRKK